MTKNSMFYPAPFLYQSDKFTEQNTPPTKAVIILPEIFGVTAHTKYTADLFAEEFHLPSFALDFFYAVNKQQNDFDYTTEMQLGVELMQKTTGELFIDIFAKAKDEIKKLYPSVKEFIVCGFCFGGKLAYLSGLDEEVTEIISFYGSRSSLPFFKEKSVLDTLADTRKNSTSLRILGLFGEHDTSISAEDCESIKNTLTKAQIPYKSYVFNAGHAFFNKDRHTYDKKATQEAWEIIKQYI